MLLYVVCCVLLWCVVVVVVVCVVPNRSAASHWDMLTRPKKIVSANCKTWRFFGLRLDPHDREGQNSQRAEHSR